MVTSNFEDFSEVTAEE